MLFQTVQLYMFLCRGLYLLSINTLFLFLLLLCVCESDMNNVLQNFKNHLKECGQIQCVQRVFQL